MGRKSSGDDYRDSQADLMRAKRKASRIVVIPKCKNKSRRKRMEADDAAWLMYYFASESGCESPFTYQFTAQQRVMIEAIRKAIQCGGDQAIAASRGEGKTTLCERLLLKYTLQGAVLFSVLFAATGSAAEDSLDSIKGDIENNARLLADYPEVCVPVAALENTPNRAHYQLVSGDRHDNRKPYEAAQSKFSWCGQEIVLPKVPGSPSAGSIIATRGLDSAVRGIKKKGKRVDVAVIDDPDTEETARSEDQAKKLEDRIDKAIAGLGGQKRRVARVMLTTLQSRISVSFKFTDPAQKQSWMGKRFRFLVEKPERMDLWEDYVQLRKVDWENAEKGTPTTLAHELYVSRRAEMEAGAVVANPNRYMQGELSALQFYFDEVARTSQDAVSTEYDNDPPESTGPIESGINPRLVRRQISGTPKGIIPAGCTVLAHACDIGKLKGFHWVVRAWKPDGTGYVIDYGNMDVLGARYGSDEGLDRAIFNAVLRRMDEFKSAGYATADGHTIDDPISTFDARWQTDAVLSAVAKAGLGVHGIIGIGRSAGCVQGSFRDLTQRTQTRRPCGTTGAYEELHVGPYGKLWVIHANADKWKAFEHDRWMTAPDRPGCMFLCGEEVDDRTHELYAKHICAEIEVEDGHKRKWISRFKENDWLDASWHSNVAAAIKGIRVLAQMPQSPVVMHVTQQVPEVSRIRELRIRRR